MLYPLKFDPVYKQIVWGGTNISKFFNRDIPLENVAESWELCSRSDGTSIVSSGKLKGMSLQNVLLKYKGKLLGKANYKKFGNCFPLLIKIIDANESLSVQVHPDDTYAEMHGENTGKNELWYVLDAKENAKLVYGIHKDESREDFTLAISENKVEQTLNMADAQAGDVFYVPAGQVHAILGGLLIAEIQQNSNTTYRIFDWGRVDSEGKGRMLDTAKALDVIDFHSRNQRGNGIQSADNLDYHADVIIRSAFFDIDKIIVHLRYKSESMDSFIIMMCIKGSGVVLYNGGMSSIVSGETVLFPACIGEFVIIGSATLLSIYMR